MYQGSIIADAPAAFDAGGAAPVRFLPSFGRRFAVFVDTEEEFDWAAPFDRLSRSTAAIAGLPDMQRRLEAHGVRPTYLVDHPIATDPACIDILGDIAARGACMIGAHLHPWVNPPFDEPVNDRNSFAGNLPLGLEHAKIDALTRAIEAAFGVRPWVYRAGRYGVGANTPAILAALGYRIDTSVRALFDYRDGGGPDFSHASSAPYWMEEHGLLELPLTATFGGALRRYGRSLLPACRRWPHGPGLMARLGLLERVALTPEGMPLRDVLEALRSILDEGVRFLSISFHSPSLVPGYTPYVRDRADLAGFHRWWDGVLAFLAAHGVAPASVDEVHDAAVAARGAACQADPASAIAAAVGPVAQR